MTGTLKICQILFVAKVMVQSLKNGYWIETVTKFKKKIDSKTT